MNGSYKGNYVGVGSGVPGWRTEKETEKVVIGIIKENSSLKRHAESTKNNNYEEC